MSVLLGSGMARLLPITQPSAPHSNAIARPSTPRLSLLCHHGSRLDLFGDVDARLELVHVSSMSARRAFDSSPGRTTVCRSTQ